MTSIDARLAILARAGAQHILVEAGEVPLDAAFGEIADAIRMIEPCTCEREIYERLLRSGPARRPQRRAA
jgi:hypothetical protein